MLDSRGIFKKFKYGELIPWVLGCSFTLYCMAWEPDTMNNSLRKFYLKGSSMTQNDIILCDTWAKMLKDGKVA
jgi:hypothetical protein